MTVDQLKRINVSVKAGKKISADIITEIAEDLRFSAEIDPLFINEVNIFVHSLHRILSRTNYYDEIEKDLDDICTMALNLSQNLKAIKTKKTGKKVISKPLIADMKKMGKLLFDMAPFIRSIAALMIILNSSDMKFFG